MKYGFIGCGNMGGAIATALSKATKDILLADPFKAESLSAELGCACGSNDQAAACDRLFLAVKPQVMGEVLAALQPTLQEYKPMLITMAAGLEIATIEKMAGVKLPVIRIMPNTPVAVGKGVIQYCHNELVSDAEIADFLQDMRYAGLLGAIDEKLIDAACSLSGCGPAFVYMFIEALADGAVACGVPRDKALEYAAATVEGAAKMASVTGKHPGVLKDAVCSPGGSTIEGVKTLEENGFRGAVMDCVAAAFKRNKELGKS